MTTLSTLHDFENGNYKVKDILMQYFNADNLIELDNFMYNRYSEMVEYWCETLDLHDEDGEADIHKLSQIIDAKLNDNAKFKVIDEEGSGGGWPDCELDLGDGVVLNMDWVTD